METVQSAPGGKAGGPVAHGYEAAVDVDGG